MYFYKFLLPLVTTYYNLMTYFANENYHISYAKKGDHKI